MTRCEANVFRYHQTIPCLWEKETVAVVEVMRPQQVILHPLTQLIRNQACNLGDWE